MKDNIAWVGLGVAGKGVTGNGDFYPCNHYHFGSVKLKNKMRPYIGDCVTYNPV